ncbi:MAG: RNA 2',3'-cyclic phosphodiesterase [Candidatus Marinimicrobia bacterium]|jgi:2'-5' RNA ligase|nr:RNA 2',3'-cyclic phosphodiesterase [Candidatus Neomarinimicrobiota bacterium]MDP6611089.1 RNA 2',3'-cyclic phosphodiesterase [Candidatus Neomarinimicrobiota bacterium]|tara:strand:+ start:5115 stop:5696 length:582 start_codon:yes stop_codon:yes gene_type:complete
MDYKLIRTFVAIPVPEPFFTLQDSLKSKVDPKKGKIRWVRKDQLHLTLKFLGDTTSDSIREVQAALQKIADESSPFNLNIQDTGCFPKVERPRVMWAGIKGDVDKLIQLAEAIQNGLDLLGFPKDRKAYHPHITIGRATYPQKHTPDISHFLRESYKPIPFRIEKVQFISSELFPNGPVYTILSTHFFSNNSV